MKVKLLQMLAVSALLMNSCAKDSIEVDSSNSPIQFDGKIGNLQAVNPNQQVTTFKQGDKIGIFMTNRVTPLSVVENNTNRQYVFGSSTFAAALGQDMFYPVNGDKVNFIAYYPYDSNIASLDDLLRVDISNQSDLSKIDYLYANVTNNSQGFGKATGGNVPLSFNHKLAKIVIRPVAGAGLSDQDISWKDMVVNIGGMMTAGTMDLSSGNTVWDGNTIKPFTAFTSEKGVSYEAIILPHAYNGSFTYSFQIGSDVYVWTNLNSGIFEAGKEYTYEITIQKTGVAVGAATVTNWTSSGNISTGSAS